jgi:hypothetical protein
MSRRQRPYIVYVVYAWSKRRGYWILCGFWWQRAPLKLSKCQRIRERFSIQEGTPMRCVELYLAADCGGAGDPLREYTQPKSKRSSKQPIIPPQMFPRAASPFALRGPEQ